MPFAMQSNDELKAEMDTIQQQMVEAKKNERANALKEVKRHLDLIHVIPSTSIFYASWSCYGENPYALNCKVKT